MTDAPLIAEVVFDVPLWKGFDYRVPPAQAGILKPGHRVYAPFGKRGRQMGILSRFRPVSALRFPLASLKSLEGPVDPEAALSEEDLRLSEWMAERYFCSLGEAAFTVCALAHRKPPKRPAKNIAAAPPEPPAAFQPTPDQRAALDQILPALAEGGAKSFLLQGVAAAGKTEVYRRAIETVLGLGKSAILLVPEIGLTPQMESLFRRWFGGAVEIWHSELADGERWRAWRRAQAGECRLVVGPRSALFLPMQKLGLIVVDEEHDPSYKQDQTPHYHARETALEKARLHGAAVILGSATPSLETFIRAKAGEFASIVMTRRVDDRPFPALHVVDMRGKTWYLSEPLTTAIADRLAKKEQTLLFLNRRGYATRVVCGACGWEDGCPHCLVTLVLHKDGGELLRCHTCEYTKKMPAVCPSCASELIRSTGRGTQRVMRDLATLFPGARFLRWDRDAMAQRHAHEAAYAAVMKGEVDVIVGTQMVAQGHDFPMVTLVGVVDADRALRFPDFRAAERTFQLVMQVAGRAGRAERPGDVFIQTRHPEHYALEAVGRRDYQTFAEAELRFRRDADYPPFSRMAQVLLRARSEAAAESAAQHFMDALEAVSLPAGTAVLGPAPAFHRQRAGWAQWQVVIKAPPALLSRSLDQLVAYTPPPGATVSVDVDPEDLP